MPLTAESAAQQIQVKLHTILMLLCIIFKIFNRFSAGSPERYSTTYSHCGRGASSGGELYFQSGAIPPCHQSEG